MGKNLISAVLLVCLLSVAGYAQKAKTDALKAGDTAPDFTLVDDGGKSVTLSSLGKPTVVVFYRAYW